MRIIFEIRVSPAQQRFLRGFVATSAVVALLGVGLAFAAPTHSFAPGAKVSAQAMNENFQELDARIKSLEGRTLGVPIASTSAKYNGALQAVGGLTGYRAARKLCQEANPSVPTAHMCTADEMVRAAQDGAGASVSDGWYAVGGYAIHDTARRVNDCDGWTTASSEVTASIWSLTAPYSDACQTLHVLVCCN